MPTRVIDVGDGHTLCLVSGDKTIPGEHYVALSHCWGEPTEKWGKDWCTRLENEKERRTQGFMVKNLPQTFQDAIRVTRELGQRYLWIDSLCIIQGKGGDWYTEAKKMEAVFRNAYYTIAATSAEDSTKGFLNRPLDDSQYVTVPRSSHGKVYICTSIDDFPGDVEEGLLNKRAWVLQERALSRRTIHFTKRQTYWECGGGVRCETLTYMKNDKFSFQSDPEFPRSITLRAWWAQIYLLQSLFKDYSKLGLTYETDRPIAIDSLAKALAEALNTEIHYGIFKCHLHLSLMWRALQNPPPTQIFYPAGKAPPPSWSWMAYNGQILYFERIQVAWDRSVQIVNVRRFLKVNYVLEARVRGLQDCEIKPEGVIHDQEDNEVGHLYFDTQSGNVPSEVRCAIIGRETEADEDGGRDYYVLFVKDCATDLERGKFGKRLLGLIGSEQLKFWRIGVGWIQQRFILFDGQDDRAQIL